jgi:hypothetical protein
MLSALSCHYYRASTKKKLSFVQTMISFHEKDEICVITDYFTAVNTISDNFTAVNASRR